MSRYNDIATQVSTAAAAPVDNRRFPCAAPGCPGVGSLGRGKAATCSAHYGKPHWQWQTITAGLLGQQGMFEQQQTRREATLSPLVLAMRAKVKRVTDRTPGEDDVQ